MGGMGQERKACVKGGEGTTSTKINLEGIEIGQKSPEGR